MAPEQQFHGVMTAQGKIDTQARQGRFRGAQAASVEGDSGAWPAWFHGASSSIWMP
jgi:hypothetical protein